MNITPKAIEEFKKALANESEISAIRIFAAEGCCGPSVQMSIVEKPYNDDIEIAIDSMKFFIEKSVEVTLNGVTIDYGQNGFKLDGLKKSSGCC